MKKIFILLALISINSFAQNNINYKALIKDGSGNVIANQLITIQFSILQGVAQTNVYQETHAPTTDANGIVILNIGAGTVDSGIYATIDWGSEDYYLNVQIDTSGGTTFTDMGTTQFMTVPYAIHSLTSSDSISKLNDLNDAKSDSDGTNDGSSIFLGINAGLNDDNTNNGNVGIGFETLKTNTTGYWNTANGYQSLFNSTIGFNNVATGYKSLYNNTEGEQNVANGNITLFNNITGSRNIAFGNNALYNNVISNNNVAFGFNAGYNALGNSNVFLGYNAGYNETESNTLYVENSDADADNALIYGDFGTDNTTTGNILRVNGELQLGNSLGNRYAMPTADGTTNQLMQTDGNGVLTWVDTSSFGVQKLNDLSDAKSDDDGTNDGSSVFLGINAGLNDDSTDNRNVGIGLDVLKMNIDGRYNTALGYQSLTTNVTGITNTAIGYQSLYSNTGGGNTAMGNASMLFNSSGSYNVAIGDAVLLNNTTGNNNTALGNQAGNSNVLGSSNIFLGYKAGFNETGSNKLYLENSNAGSNSALIYGEFGTDNTTIGNILRVNGELQLGNSLANRYAMPTADGTTNQLMQTDGNGVLTWVDTSSFGVQKLNDLSDAKSDSDGTNDGSSVFIGLDAGLIDDSTDNKNVGLGYQSLKSNITGVANTASGYHSLFSNTSGNLNTAYGYLSLYSSTTAIKNTAFGQRSLYNNVDGFLNLGIGSNALFSNQSSDRNIAIGSRSLYNHVTGDSNIAIGNDALLNNISGSWNLALGHGALNKHISSNSNVALGFNAGYNALGNSNVFIGYSAGFNETGSNTLYLDNSDADADNALIYGKFGTDNTTTGNILRINGKLQLGNSLANRYAMPTADGTANQVIQTNGSGFLSWVDSSTLINGLLRADGNTWPTTGAGVEIAYDNSSGIGYIQSYDRDTSIWKDLEITANEIKLKTNNTSRVTVQNDGKVKILVTSDASGIPGTGSLEIGGGLRLDNNEIITNTNTTLYIQNDNEGDLRVDNSTLVVDASANRVGFKTLTPSTDLHLKQSDNLQGGGGGITFESALDVINWKIYHSGSAISFAENGVRRAYISASTGAYVQTSDRTLKKNITRLEDDVLSKLSKIEIYRYHYLGQNPSEEKTLGVMAQEIQLQFPELVTTGEDGKLGMNYAGLSVVAIKAIKEQQVIIDNQQKQIDELTVIVKQLLDAKD